MHATTCASECNWSVWGQLYVSYVGVHQGQEQAGTVLGVKIVHIRDNLTNPGSAKEVSMDQFQA